MATTESPVAYIRPLGDNCVVPNLSQALTQKVAGWPPVVWWLLSGVGYRGSQPQTIHFPRAEAATLSGHPPPIAGEGWSND